MATKHKKERQNCRETITQRQGETTETVRAKLLVTILRQDESRRHLFIMAWTEACASSCFP